MSDVAERLAREVGAKLAPTLGIWWEAEDTQVVADAIREAVRASATVAWTAVQAGYGADGVHGRILDQIGE